MVVSAGLRVVVVTDTVVAEEALAELDEQLTRANGSVATATMASKFHDDLISVRFPAWLPVISPNEATSLS